MSGTIPMFSIVMPTYNRREMCKRAIRSVLAQQNPDWELVVVDDGSSDDTESAVLSFGDPRIHYVRQDNAGVCLARNRGIDAAQGEYVCFLDSDDEYLPGHLAILKAAIEGAAPTTGIMLFTLAYSDCNGIRTPLAIQTSTPATPILLGDNPETSSICISASVLKKNKFDPRMKKHEDAELWGRIAKLVPVTRVEERTVVFHWHDAPRMTAGTKQHFLQMIDVYAYISSTRSIRSPIPDWALRRKWKQIYLGLLESSPESAFGEFIADCWSMLRRAGITPFFGRRFAHILLNRARPARPD